MNNSSPSHPPGRAVLAHTHWTAVLTAGRGGESAAVSEALEELCRTYWQPLYVYIRGRGYGVPEAQDLTQEFFARLLEQKWLSLADPRRGKFRSFLLSAMNHFLANEWRRSQALKRGGGAQVVELDASAEARYAAEFSSGLSPEKLYERRWAVTLLERALARLREQYVAAGKARLFECLKEFLSCEVERGDYERVGRELGLSDGAVATAVHRLKSRYREMVREEVTRTVASPEEIEGEMRSLLAALT